MMSGMSQLSRRAVLQLGAGAALGAAGAYAFGTVLDRRPSTAVPRVTMTGVGAPLAPLPLEPPAAAAPTMVTGSFASAARGGIATNWAMPVHPDRPRPCAR